MVEMWIVEAGNERGAFFLIRGNIFFRIWENILPSAAWVLVTPDNKISYSTFYTLEILNSDNKFNCRKPFLSLRKTSSQAPKLCKSKAIAHRRTGMKWRATSIAKKVSLEEALLLEENVAPIFHEEQRVNKCHLKKHSCLSPLSSLTPPPPAAGLRSPPTWSIIQSSTKSIKQSTN